VTKELLDSRAGTSETAVEETTGFVAEGDYSLRLYIAGQTPKSLAAIANLKQLCETYLAGRYSIEVIDLLVTPTLAAGDQIVALPTLVRRLPPPLKRVIGDLANTERVLVGLDIRPKDIKSS